MFTFQAPKLEEIGCLEGYRYFSAEIYEQLRSCEFHFVLNFPADISSLANEHPATFVILQGVMPFAHTIYFAPFTLHICINVFGK